MNSLAGNISVSGAGHLFMLISTMSYNYSYKCKSADAISEIIDEMFLKPKITFNIATSQNPKVNMDIFLARISRNHKENFSYQIYRNDENRKKVSTVFLAQDISELDNVHYYIKKVMTRTNYSTSLRYLIYCDELTLENYKITIRPSMHFDRRDWEEHAFNYYAIDSLENVTLLTYFVRQNPEGVGSINPYKLNLEVAATFDKRSWKWIGDLERLKGKWKHEDMKGMTLLAILINGTFFDSYKNEATGRFSGVLVDIMNVVGQKYQMNIIYNYHQLARQVHSRGDMIPTIYVSTHYSSEDVIVYSHLTSTYTENVYRVVITRPSSLTSYEKLAMPFDKTTWVLLGLTFGAAFAVTVIVNKQSRWIQDIVYGKNVRMPGYNIVSIFFGIGQSKLPMLNFPRIILVLFIWFCFIIRTAYVGVLFELLALDIQRPPPQTLLELIKENFTFVYDSRTGHSLLTGETAFFMQILDA
jgi:hypothetical protein